MAALWSMLSRMLQSCKHLVVPWRGDEGRYQLLQPQSSLWYDHILWPLDLRSSWSGFSIQCNMAMLPQLAGPKPCCAPTIRSSL